MSTPATRAIIRINKRIAQKAFGGRPGRPTISRRAGGHIGSAVGVSGETGTMIFHVALLVAAAVALVGVLAGRVDKGKGKPALPPGWRRAKAGEVTPTDAVGARAALAKPIGTLVELDAETAAFVEWHWDERRGWHKGASILKR